MTIVIAIIAIWIVWAIIATIVERHRQGIRDRVAHEVLDDAFDFESEKAEVLAINRTFGFVSTDQVCPSCSGTLVVRHGIYGRFFGCSNYPKCKFTRQID